MLPHRRLQATLRALTHSTVQRDDHEPCVQGFAPSSLDWLVSPPRQRSQIIYPHYFVKKTAVETHHNAFFYPADRGQGHNLPHAQLTFSLHFIKGLSEYMKLRHTESDDMNVNEGVFSVACHTG